MSGQAAFDKLVRPTVQEREDGMSDQEGGGIYGEEELAAPDWRLRAGPRNKPTQKEREREKKSTKQHTYRSETGVHVA